LKTYEELKIVHLISGLGAGGAERTLVNLITSDKKHKHFVIYFSNNTFFLNELKQHNIKTFYMPTVTAKSKVLLLFLLHRILKEIKFDVLQTWMYHADSLGALIRVFFPQKPLLWNVRNSALQRRGKPVTNFLIKLNSRLSFVFPSKIIYCAQQARADHEQLGYRQKIGHVISNGVNTKTFRPMCEYRNQIRKKYLKFDDDTFCIGYVARYDPQKDFSTLFAAFRILVSRFGNCRLVLAGRGCDAENHELSTMLAKYKVADKTILLGRTEIFGGFYELFDILVLCSRYGEGFPNVVAEAMASGIPCIATDSGDAAFLIGERNCLSLQGDQLKLAENMLRLYGERNSPVFNLEKQRVRARIEALFSLDKMLESYRALWESVSGACVSSVTAKRY